jgi:hypothetical protein
VSPGRGWELDGTQRHLMGLFLRHLSPTHMYEILMVLVSYSRGFLSGLHCLSLQVGERCVQNSCNFDCSLLKDCPLFYMVEIRVFSVLWGLVQPLGFSQKGEVCPLYPVFHPTSIHSGQIPGFPVGPGMGHI